MKDLIVIENNKEKEEEQNNSNYNNNKTVTINKNVNDNLVAVILILLIILVIVKLVLYVYELPKDNDKYLRTEDEIHIIDENPRNFVLKDYENTIETDERLTALVQTFNSSNAVYKLHDLGYELDAIAQGDIIIIETFGDGLSFSVKFELVDNVLSTVLEYDEKYPEVSAIKMILGSTLLDTAAQVKGFEEGQMMGFLSHDSSFYCTLEEDGFSVEVSEDGRFLTYKINLDSELNTLKEFWNSIDALEMQDTSEIE